MSTTISPPPVGAELRRWREQRALSQLALAGRAEVSTRHLSYVETGRSRPTSAMIVRLAECSRCRWPSRTRCCSAAGSCRATRSGRPTGRSSPR
ncbi:helix-turn-helix domain-containing protein [Janibacter alkaliphilus]|uniref:helix-turn-helix domain-containing protein n=1 Tax=Janibacter alkaliphilus TaxID=1069963 RepID=UPI001C53914A